MCVPFTFYLNICLHIFYDASALIQKDGVSTTGYIKNFYNSTTKKKLKNRQKNLKSIPSKQTYKWPVSTQEDA